MHKRWIELTCLLTFNWSFIRELERVWEFHNGKIMFPYFFVSIRSFNTRLTLTALVYACACVCVRIIVGSRANFFSTIFSLIFFSFPFITTRYFLWTDWMQECVLASGNVMPANSLLLSLPFSPFKFYQISQARVVSALYQLFKRKEIKASLAHTFFLP